MKYQIHFSGLSDIGHIRDNNEDAWAAHPDFYFFTVADGMGGHRAGEVAAKSAVETVSDIVRKMIETSPDLTFDEMQGALHYAMAETNTTVNNLSKTSEEYQGMGTTLCSLLFHPEGLVYGHVGDSRIYRFRDSQLDQLTKDHSLVAELREQGKLSQEGAEESSFKNVITRAIGTEPNVEPSVHMTEIEKNDIYFMCTDGLTDMLSSSDIEGHLKQQKPVEETVKTLVEEAKRKGGLDNITILMVQVQ